MYVKRLKLYGVRGFRLDLPLDGRGDLPLATRKRLLLQGGNGSGKSTVIETIAGLWDCFGKMIDEDASSPPFAELLRRSAELNAVELGDFPTLGTSFWIAVGTFGGIDALKKAHPQTPMACMQLRGEQYSQDHRITLPAGDWKAIKIRSQEGVEPMPNVVHFPPDGRSVLRAPPGGVSAWICINPTGWRHITRNTISTRCSSRSAPCNRSATMSARIVQPPVVARRQAGFRPARPAGRSANRAYRATVPASPSLDRVVLGRTADALVVRLHRLSLARRFDSVDRRTGLTHPYRHGRRLWKHWNKSCASIRAN